MVNLLVGPVGLTFDASGNLYAANHDDGKIINVDPATLLSTSVFYSGTTGWTGLTTDGSGNMYAVNYDNGYISKINIANPSGGGTTVNWSTGFIHPYYAVISGAYMYVSNTGTGAIIQVNMSNGSIANSTWVSGLSAPSGIAISGSLMYIVQTGGTGVISTVPFPAGGTPTTFITGLTTSGVPTGLNVYNGIIYVENTNDQYISVFDQSTGSSLNNTWLTITGPNQIIVYNNNLYYTNYGLNTVNTHALYNGSPPLTCFLEGTRVLCKIDDCEEYVPVEKLKKGTLVKTYANDYKKVVLIGKGTIQGNTTTEESPDRLYKCSKLSYYDLTDDLYLTGGHSLLVDSFSYKEHKKTLQKLGEVFFTGDKLRLLACIDERAEPWVSEGTYTIWHFALENDKPHKNYGVYVNGHLLVESCSITVIENESTNLELIQ
jgi:hypothetical protein